MAKGRTNSGKGGTDSGKRHDQKWQRVGLTVAKGRTNSGKVPD